MVYEQSQQVNIFMTNRERKTLLETRLRNLKRKYARIIQHSDLIEQAIELKAEIDGIEREVTMMQEEP